MNRKTLGIAAVAASMTVMIGGCQTLDAYTQESKTSSTAKGPKTPELLSFEGSVCTFFRSRVELEGDAL